MFLESNEIVFQYYDCSDPNNKYEIFFYTILRKHNYLSQCIMLFDYAQKYNESCRER